jgi:radical SAM protein with 4Fe4S-binding SPASM domain
VLGVASGNGCYLVKLNPVNTLGLAQRLVRQKVLLTVKEIVALYEKRKEFESRFGIFIYVEGPPAFASLYDMVSGHAAICPFTQILGVLSDGSISFCGIGNSCPELIFGRIDERGFNLARFWHEAEALVEVRKVLTRKLQGVCARCVLEPFCKGSCRALAYGDFKSFSAPHPWCQSAYDEGTFPSQYLTQQMEGS